MQVHREVNPADIRFTQDSISLCFQFPYDYFSVREAVRELSKNRMRPDDFPAIRVISYGGCLWSIDNRRLWVFRLARCSSIAVNLVEEVHPRLIAILSNAGLHSMMQVEDYFPRLRDKGQKDPEFDRQFPQPVPSLQRQVDEALEEPPINMALVSNVDTENFGTSTMPPKPSIDRVQENEGEEHQYGQIYIDIIEEYGTTDLQKPSIHPKEDPAKDEHQPKTAHTWKFFAIARRLLISASFGIIFVQPLPGRLLVLEG